MKKRVISTLLCATMLVGMITGCVAQKAALVWIGRMFAGFAAEGARMAAGQAFLALAEELQLLQQVFR